MFVYKSPSFFDLSIYLLFFMSFSKLLMNMLVKRRRNVFLHAEFLCIFVTSSKRVINFHISLIMLLHLLLFHHIHPKPFFQKSSEIVIHTIVSFNELLIFEERFFLWDSDFWRQTCFGFVDFLVFVCRDAIFRVYISSANKYTG